MPRCTNGWIDAWAGGGSVRGRTEDRPVMSRML